MADVSTECFTPVRGSGIRITGLTDRGALPEIVPYATSKSVVRVGITEVTDPAKNEALRNPENARRLRLTKAAKTIRNIVDVDFLRVDPGVLSLVAGVDLVYRPDPEGLGFGEGEFGGMYFGGPLGDLVGFDVGTRLNAVSFALEVWTKLAGQRCADGTPLWGYTLFPYLRGGRVSGFTFENGLVSFNLRGAQTRRVSRWGVGPHDMTGPFERLISPVSRNTASRTFMTTAPPPAQANGIQYLGVDIISNGTPANPMPYPDAPFILNGGTPADAGPYIISGGRP